MGGIMVGQFTWWFSCAQRQSMASALDALLTWQCIEREA